MTDTIAALRLSDKGQSLLGYLLKQASRNNGNILDDFRVEESGDTTIVVVVIKAQSQRTSAPGFVQDMRELLVDSVDHMVRLAYRIYRQDEPEEVQFRMEFADQTTGENDPIQYVDVTLEPGDLVPGLDVVHREMDAARGMDTVGSGR